MNLINYLKDIYGYDTPIFLKDIRIGGKSKTAIKQEFYRATKNGKIERKSDGIYFIRSEKQFGSGVTFKEILEKKYLYTDKIDFDYKDLFVEGYYSGMSFLNMIGISEQVPSIPEITTNKTSSKKRFYSSDNFVAIIRKSRTTINYQNYKILQFLDMFHFLSLSEVQDKKDLIIKYVKDNKLSKNQFSQYIKFYSTQTMKKIVEGGIINAFM